MDIEILQNLEKLKELKDKEIISEEEFNLKKKELLKEKPTSRDINNNFVWALAFAPIIGIVIEAFISSAFYIPIGNLWFITIIINIALSYWDAKQLKDIGYEEKFLDNAWFIPGYLFERGKMLKENPVYLWIWIGCFFLILI